MRILSSLLLVSVWGFCACDNAEVFGPDADVIDPGDMSVTFQVEPALVAINPPSVQGFQLKNIDTFGFELENGTHYHIYLDSLDGQWIIASNMIPDSPDVLIPEDTSTGPHVVIVSIENEIHERLGVTAMQPLEVVAP